MSSSENNGERTERSNTVNQTTSAVSQQPWFFSAIDFFIASVEESLLFNASAAEKDSREDNLSSASATAMSLKGAQAMNDQGVGFRRRENRSSPKETFSAKDDFDNHRMNSSSSSSVEKQRGEDSTKGQQQQQQHAIAQKDTDNSQNQQQQQRTNSVNQATVNLINGILGTGALGLPYCFKLTGVALTTLLIILSFVACCFTTQCLLYASTVTEGWTYEEVAFRTLGNKGRTLVRVCVVALLLGCSVAYVNIVSDIFSGVAGTIVPAGAEPSRGETMVAVVVFGFVPLGTMVRSAKALSSTSTFGVFIVWIFTLSVAGIYFFKSSVYPDLYVEHRQADSKPLQTWDSSNIMIVLPVLSFGFAATPILYPVVQTLRDPTNNRILTVSNKSLFVAAMAYFVIGLMGYLTFQDSVSGDILRNFGAEKGYWGVLLRTLKLLYCVSMATCIPLVFISLRESLTPAVLKICSAPDSQKEISRSQDAGLNAFLFGASLAMAFYIPNVEFVFGLVGATACSTLLFTAPCLIFLASTAENSGSYAKASSKIASFGWVTTLGLTTSRTLARLFCIFGVFLLIVSTEHTLRAVHEEQTLVDLVSSLHAAETKASEAAVMYEKVYEAADKFQRVEKAESELTIAQSESEKTMQIVKDAVASLERLSSSRETSSSNDFKSMFFGSDNDDKAHEEVFKKTIEEVSEMSKTFGNVTIGSLIEAEATLEELSDEIDSEKADLEKIEKEEKEQRDKETALIAEATGTVVDFESIDSNKAGNEQRSKEEKDLEREGKEVEKLVADESESVKKVFETQSALSVLHDVATEVIGAMDVSHAGVSSASARAQSRLHEVQNVLNTTQMTAEVIKKTLADLKEAKETQSENVLKAVMKAIENSGRNDEEGKDLMEALAQVENDARELAEKKEAGEKEYNEASTGFPRFPRPIDAVNENKISDETVAKLLDATKTAAEKMVVSEVEDVMKKTSKVKAEIVDRAAEIARQLRPKSADEKSDKPSINALFDISDQVIKTTSASTQSNDDIQNTNELTATEPEDIATNASSSSSSSYEERKKAWKIKPLLDNEFFEKKKLTTTTSSSAKEKEEKEQLALDVENFIEEREEKDRADNDADDLNWDQDLAKQVG
jgi:amino acid permease